MTAAGQVYAGARLTAATVQGVAPLAAYKTSADQSAQSVTSSTTLVDDNALAVTLQPNAVYDFELVIGYTGASGGGGIQLAWSLPSGATMGYSAYGNSGGSATDAPWETESSVVALSSSGTSTPVSAMLQGTVATGSAGGAMQLQWAQDASSATPTTVLAGSVLACWQVL